MRKDLPAYPPHTTEDLDWACHCVIVSVILGTTVVPINNLQVGVPQQFPLTFLSGRVLRPIWGHVAQAIN